MNNLKRKNLIVCILVLSLTLGLPLNSYSCSRIEGKIIVTDTYSYNNGVNSAPTSFWSSCWYLNNSTTREITRQINRGSDVAGVAAVLTAVFGQAQLAYALDVSSFMIASGATAIENKNNGKGVAIHFTMGVPTTVYTQTTFLR